MVFQVKYANYLLHQGNKAYFCLPESEQKLHYLIKQIQERTDEPLLNTKGQTAFYFATKIKDLGSEQMEEEENR